MVIARLELMALKRNQTPAYQLPLLKGGGFVVGGTTIFGIPKALWNSTGFCLAILPQRRQASP